MESTETRVVLSDDDVRQLQEPQCRIPRPGDVIVWYQPGVRQRGTLVGHTWDGRPFIHPGNGSMNRLPSFDMIRIEDRSHAAGPIWRTVRPPGLLARPTQAERERLRVVSGRVLPPGVRHCELVAEIWEWGFEAFLAGGSVRDVLAGVPGRDAEVVTTMPVTRLRQMIEDMYGADRFLDGEAVWQAGCFRIGSLASVAEQYLDVRAFRYAAPGTGDAVFGASFEQDLAWGDFSCNAVYYDMINDVLIDPSGFGIDDAVTCRLRPVMDFAQRSNPDKARIGLQLIGRCLMADPEGQTSADQQACRRYQLAAEASSRLLELVDSLAALSPAELATEVREKIFARLRGDKAEKWDKLHDWLKAVGKEALWTDLIEPSLESQR